ncbi:unnamed protein product [Notodromas monacha]|uniref:BPL/LPL catalytic domain-containing protein n=1 Tax=Notodromas monacha TaxID=399045 RepID=A0A7R9BIB2_9CRUS|nr:unnamed protein product [Notodromas monacha]CAG0915242.1 unnamed protein product [Notodromas monacha]
MHDLPARLPGAQRNLLLKHLPEPRMLCTMRSVKLLPGTAFFTGRRSFAAGVSKEAEPLKKLVYISQSNDVFTNLALEDWLYKQGDFKNSRALLLWRNSPCVVVGRHQNPWVEANADFCAEKRIPIARRNSGGGTVYHDLGNLNCTFFTSRDEYDRKANLEMIRTAVWDTYGLDLVVNKRDDIEWRGQKVSGTAAKLGRDVAYHHCTVLVHSDRSMLQKALRTGGVKGGYESKATISVPAKTACLREAEPSARVSDVMNAIGRVFLQNPIEDKHGNTVPSEAGGYQLLNPSDYWFPGLGSTRRDLASWDWVYGKTPNFSFSRTYSLPKAHNAGNNPQEHGIASVTVTLHVTNGMVTETEIKENDSFSQTGGSDLMHISALKGQRFTEHLLDAAVQRTVSAAMNAYPRGSSGNHRAFSPGPRLTQRSLIMESERNHDPMDREYVNSILTCA